MKIKFLHSLFSLIRLVFIASLSTCLPKCIYLPDKGLLSVFSTTLSEDVEVKSCKAINAHKVTEGYIPVVVES